VRKTGLCEGFHVCIDSIPGLGDFIELEQMGRAHEADIIQGRMRDFLKSLRITPDDEVKKGYDILMLEKTI
jgi:adenylate cyclase class IV